MEILEMCPKDITDICMLWKDDENMLVGPPIIELESKKDILVPHIIIEGEKNQLRMKKDQLYVKDVQFGHPKKYCTNCAGGKNA